jgi:hypothetical protein
MLATNPKFFGGSYPDQFEPLFAAIPEPINELFSTQIASEVVRLSVIESRGRRFRLAAPIVAFMDAGRDGVAIEFPPLGIFAHGDTRADAECAFGAEFAALWDSIAQADDSFLTKDAQRLKTALRKLVAAVEV